MDDLLDTSSVMKFGVVSEQWPREAWRSRSSRETYASRRSASSWTVHAPSHPAESVAAWHRGNVAGREPVSRSLHPFFSLVRARSKGTGSCRRS